DASSHSLEVQLPQKKQQHGMGLAGSTVNLFLDIEAAVAGDDKGDEEADEDDLNFFINNQDLNEANGSHAHSNLEAKIATQPHGTFLSALTDKYGPCTRVSSSPATESQEAGVSQNSLHVLVSLPPQEGDWELWEVPVTVHLWSLTSFHLILTQYNRELLKDSMFIMLPPRAPSHHMNRWVSLKIRLYVNDLAFVCNARPNAQLDVLLTTLLNKKQCTRPAAKLFDPEKVALSGSTDLHTSGLPPPTTYTYSLFKFDSSGFLLKRLNALNYHHVEIHPTTLQLAPFMKCTSIPTNVKLHVFCLACNQELKSECVGTIDTVLQSFTHILLDGVGAPESMLDQMLVILGIL
ncbi:hypothetical protein P691DRAFT_785274, partial [Macrolepiota fuliginosa MF-IS2]